MVRGKTMYSAKPYLKILTRANRWEDDCQPDTYVLGNVVFIRKLKNTYLGLPDPEIKL